RDSTCVADGVRQKGMPCDYFAVCVSGCSEIASKRNWKKNSHSTANSRSGISDSQVWLLKMSLEPQPSDSETLLWRVSPHVGYGTGKQVKLSSRTSATP